jgi:hypothetical protein
MHGVTVFEKTKKLTLISESPYYLTKDIASIFHQRYGSAVSCTIEFDKSIVLEKLVCLGAAMLLVLPFSLEVSMWILIVASYRHSHRQRLL